MRKKMWSLFLLLLMMFIPAAVGLYSNQPRFRSDNGHLYIESATGRNISLNTKGLHGYINVNNENLLQVIEKAKEAWDVVESFRTDELPVFSEAMKNVMPLIDGPKSLSSRVTALEMQMLNSTAIATPAKPGKSGTVPNAAKFGSRLSALEKKVTNLVNLLSISECLSNPCQNGGTCMDMYNGFQCSCPQNWQGRLCELDVDECVRLAHTDLGCQNGAECKNTMGGYECICPANWYGLHCTKRKNDCNGAQAAELCGHGVCVNRPSTDGYTCICDEGWTTEDNNRPACTKDVDECTENRHLCSVNPPVECRNTKGSFTCGSCPPGYEGNGFVCTDVNECLVNNGGCSMNPRVQCINTRGSFKCESCPSGYRGDGFNCVYATGGACAINNGNCHPNADCTVYGETTIQCTCRAGYKGSGYGPNGCVVDTATARDPCASIPCGPHGSCIPTAKNTSFTCNCEAGYTGKTCNVGMADPCFVNPCENGECIPGLGQNSFVCNCFAGFSGRLCESELGACGGYLESTNGTLRYPAENTTTYGGNMNCAWTIDGDSTDVINISFVWIDIEKSPDCRFDSVEIINGDESDGKSVGKFCGNTLPTNNSIVSESNVVVVRFRSDQSRNFGGFQLNYTSARPICGGEISADSHGTLSSPGSPGKYPPSRDCYWTLNALPGKRIQLHFFTVRFESHRNCSFDYLEIRDGLTQHSPTLAKLCNATVPPPIITSGQHVNIHFHSDSSGQDYGFQMAYSVVEGIPGCGGIYTSPSGFISSPVDLASGSNNYLDNLNCEWHIRMPLNQKLKLSFVNKFHIETSSNCSADVLTIYDGPNEKSPLIGRYCGTTRFVHPIMTNSNEVTIIFKSDFLTTGEGFTIKYETLCGGMFTDSKGIIESPFYPNPYPASKICTYLIAQPVGKAIKLSFLDMDLEDLSSPKCLFDSLEIRDGDNENSTKIALLCGNVDKLPKLPFISTHNYMWLKFESDLSNNNFRGFRANYSTIDIACGGILKEPAGIIQSSKHPEQYLHNQMCKWIISVNESSQIQLTWLTFSLENQLSCNNDYVEIFDNSISGNASKIARYCGSKVPPVLTSLGNRLTIVFRTDHSVAKDGFMLNYISLSKSQACGGNFFTTQGFLKSPNFPDSYPQNKDCVWTINVPVSNQIELNITQFQLEESINCRFDFLEIRNGGYPTSPLIGRYCGTKYLPIVSSMGNSLFVRFVSDSSKEQKGFMMRWSVTTKGCGGTLNTDNGHITSPNYPLPVQETLECFYKIAVAKGSQIRLTIMDLELTTTTVFPTQECKYDFVEFYDGGNTASKSLGKYCSDAHSSTVLHSSSNQMYIKFRNSGFSKGRGFSLLYVLDCNVTTKGYQGAIEMSSLESMRMAKCAWTIVAPKGSKVNLVFTALTMGKNYIRPLMIGQQKFQFAVNNNCNNTQLIISEGDGVGETNAVLWKECLAEPPPVISSTKNVVKVNYNSRNRMISYYDNIESFRIEWAVEGCGGTLDKPSGEFTSPGYPGSYPGSTTCEWHIVINYGYTVEITVENFWLESSATCSFDYLAIYSGYDDSGPELLRLCDQHDKPITVTSGGNEAFVRFETDSNFQRKGFKATYTTVPTKCGGKFTAPRGFIHTSHYPQNYDSNSPCLWYIEVAETHLINLTFVDFLTRNNDLALVYDGDVHGKLLLNHSGNSVPPPIVSSSNKLVVLFEVGKSSILAKGFNAMYSTACGARLVTNDSGIISNQAYLTDAMNQVCSWTIISDTPQSRVTLTFTHIDVVHHLAYLELETNGTTETENVCSNGLYHTTFRVLDGRESDSPEITKFCKSTPIPPPIVSNGPAMRIEFTDNSGGSDKFSALYSVRSIACGGTYDTTRGTISSPNYPNNYNRDSECVWTLKSSVGNRVSLTFVAFELEDDEFCNEDYVEIRERNSSGPILGLFCGPNLPTNVTSGSTLWVKFRSNSEGSAKGFTADFQYVKHLLLAEESGEISSPAYPRKYRHEDDYSWTISVDEGKSVQIVVKEVLCTSYSHHLKIYDGVNAEAPTLFELGLGKNDDLLQNKTIITEDSTAYIQLHAGSRRVGGISFMLSWSQVDTPDFERPVYNNNSSANKSDYDYYLSPKTNSSVIITSPGYPNGYAPNLNLTWTIHAEPHYQIEIDFLDVNLYPTSSSSSSETYSKDYITVETVDPDTAKTVLLKTISKNVNRDIDKRVIGYNRASLTFITNKALNGTGFKAQAKLRCGGRLRGPTGVIDLTNRTSHFVPDDNRMCTWNVTVRPGRTITVKILTLDLASQYACTYSYVLLKNGFYEDSSLVGQGKFCANESTTVNTIDNHLQIQFRMAPRDMVKIAFEEKSINCGGQIHLNDLYNFTEISSPSYPNIPPAHIECVWTIMAPPGERVSAVIEDLQLALDSEEKCEKEYLEFRDGASRLSRLLHHICDSSVAYANPDISTTENYLYVKYFTDISVPSNGFKMNVSIAKCGGTRRAMRGTISSPNFPGSYESNSECEYRIITSGFRRISLNFETLNLKRRYPNIGRKNEEIINNTYDDSLTIFDVEPLNQTRKLITTIFGSNIPSTPIKSTGLELVIKFKSYPKNGPFYVDNGQGKFLITYRAEWNSCDREFNAESGEIVSPQYGRTNEPEYCSYSITVPKGRRITAEVTEGQSIVETCDPDRARKDHRERLVGYIGEGSFFNAPVCSTPVINTASSNYVFESNSNKMTFGYEISSSIKPGDQVGFRLKFSSDKPAICGGTIDPSIGGSIALPPENKTTYVCDWDFTNTNGTVVIAANFKVDQNNMNCNYDSISLAANEDEGLLKTYCPAGSNRNDKFTILSPFPTTTLAVKASSRIVNFTANFDYSVNPCGGVIKGQKITITSPNYPKSFPENTHCAWSLTLPDGENVNIRFHDLDLESSCDNNHVTVHDGPEPDSPVLGRYCGDGAIPEVLGAMSNRIWIVFSTVTGNSTKKGFNLTVESTRVGCGMLYATGSGELSTRNYPQLYPNNEECEWTIGLLQGNRVNLQFVDRFSIEQSVNCTKDYVQVFDYRNGEWVPVGDRLCGRSNPPPFVSSETKLKVRLRTDGDVQGDGFKAKWSSSCGGVYTESSGRIVSPNFPRSYSSNTMCNYTISTTGKTLQFTFKSFQLEDSECRFDNVTIYDEIGDLADHTEHSVGLYCGDRLPRTLTVKNDVMIIFRTDSTVNRAGFEIHYQVQTCGGEITSPGLITSPTDIDEDEYETTGYPNDANCTWIIRAPAGQVVQLAFTQFHLEGSSFERHLMYYGVQANRSLQCIYDAVSVFDDVDRKNNDTQGIGLFCGDLSGRLPVVKSKTSTMYVVFTSDSSRRFTGFVGEISFTYGEAQGCGGTIRLNQTNSTSGYRLKAPNIPVKTELNCGWLILVDPAYEVQIELISYVEAPKCPVNTTGCGCSSIKLFDGPGRLAPLIRQHCSGSVDNPPARTSGHEAYVLYSFFNVDVNVTFDIKITPVISVCGPKSYLVTEQTQVLTSPHYPQPYDNNLICKWSLDKPITDSKPIMLRLTNVDLESTKDCSSDYLEVSYSYMAFFSPVTVRLCHEDHELDLMSDSRVWLTLRTNEQKTSKGFRLEFKNSNCLPTYTRPNGRISYEMFGTQKPEECTFTINLSQPNLTISAYIYLGLGFFGNRTSFGYVMAYDGPSTSSPLLANYTQLAMNPPPIFSSGPTLTMSTRVNERWSGMMEISYTSTDQGKGCGGTMVNVMGMVTSPSYPAVYRKSSTCRWDIAVPRPYPVIIGFRIFNLGTAATCATDYLEIYDVDQVTKASTFVIKYCGGDHPAYHTSQTGAVSVRYVTSEHNDGSGWVMHYRMKHNEF